MQHPRVSRRTEIIKSRAEINAKETKETIAKINKDKWIFYKNVLLTPITTDMFRSNIVGFLFWFIRSQRGWGAVCLALQGYPNMDAKGVIVIWKRAAIQYFSGWQHFRRQTRKTEEIQRVKVEETSQACVSLLLLLLLLLLSRFSRVRLCAIHSILTRTQSHDPLP